MGRPRSSPSNPSSTKTEVCLTGEREKILGGGGEALVREVKGKKGDSSHSNRYLSEAGLNPN